MSFILTYKDPSKKKLQAVEIVLMVLMLPLGLYGAGKAYQQYATFKQAEQLMVEGDHLLHEAKFEEASKLFAQSVELQPDYYVAWELLCTSLHNQGLHRQELNTYRQALEKLPDAPLLIRDAGACMHENELHEEEYTLLSRAIKLIPEDVFCQNLWRHAQNCGKPDGEKAEHKPEEGPPQSSES